MHLPGFVLLAVLSLLTACGEKPPSYYQGYAEGEFVQVAAPIGGRLERLAVRRGETVRAGELLFSLEHAAESAAVAEAQKNLEQAENLLNDLLKGERPSELAALAARLEQARVARDLSRVELERRQDLYEANVLSAEERDRARTAFHRDEAAVADLEAQLRTARLGARSDRIEAARAETEAARARLEQARWALAQKSQSAGADASVFDTIFEVGEFVPASLPVVTLLPPGQIKVRFFVPEPAVGTLRIGQRVAVTFDGSGGAIDAVIVFISPRAEFTPPLIYSRETRAKLVFLVEARPAPTDAPRLHPGQPVEVRLEAPP
ncbi:MAG TPA: HlyD family efflux transporter periplasmic adaptor subunit [Desulfuromonadales bacterium]|nr:HlyD family efflux transporter periplasmic adaptor subunit [Desulfuromonadales bacterium]